jgi:hypothetical protein
MEGMLLSAVLPIQTDISKKMGIIMFCATCACL